MKALGAGALTTSLAGCLGGKSKLQKELDELQSKVSKYDKNRKQAMKDGWGLVLGPSITKMGWHLVNVSHMKSQAKNGATRDKPVALVYDDKGNLGGVEWAIPANAVSSNPDIFSDEKSKASEDWSVQPAETHVFATPDGKQNDPKSFSLSDWYTKSHWTVKSGKVDVSPGDTFTGNWGGWMGEERGSKGKRVVDFVVPHPDLRTLHVWFDVPTEQTFKVSNEGFYTK